MRAVHLPGGDYFADVRIDLAASLRVQTEWLESAPRTPVRRTRVAARADRAFVALQGKLGLRDFVVQNALESGWLDEFRDYWSNVIDGREITVQDFHQLRFEYRRRAQYNEAFEWSNPEEHIAHWQLPDQLSVVFFFVYREALHPLHSGFLFEHLRPGMKVLEYGCGGAPSYRTWRRFLSYRQAQWTLADIGGFAFHYARHCFGRDANARFVMIEDFADPLGEVGDERFEMIVITDVFEHLDHPRAVAEHLVEKRLAPGGKLVFNFARCDAVGHNTPEGVTERPSTLEYLGRELDCSPPLDEAVTTGLTVGVRRKA